MKNLFILLLFPLLSYAQLNDLARIDYTYIPEGNGGVTYNRFRALFNYPIKLKNKEEYLLVGIDYSNIYLDFGINPMPFDKETLGHFQIANLNIAYTKPLKNNWRFGARITPSFSTNLTAKQLLVKDLRVSADVIFIKKLTSKNKKKRKLILGIRYSRNGGFPYPLPFVSYYKKLNPKWSYNLGVPKTNLQHFFSEKDRLKLFAQLDGFNANIQNGILLDNLETAATINMSLIISGLQYEHYFTKRLQFYARTAYIFTSKVRLRDTTGESVFTLNNNSKMYIRTGLRFKIF